MAKSIAQQQSEAEHVEDEEVKLPSTVFNHGRATKKVRSGEKKEAVELAFETGCNGKRRRKFRKHDLSAVQLQRIAQLVVEEGISQVETASLCNVRLSLVSNLIKKVK